MAKQRGPDGVPIDVPSVINKGEKSNQAAGDQQTEHVDFGGDQPTMPPNRSDNQGSNAPTGKGLFLDDPPTMPPKKNPGTDTARDFGQVVDDEPKTVIAGGRRRQTENQAQPSIGTAPVAEQKSTDAMDDPVVGWLVVVQGPGQGNFVKLGYGQNSLGRSPGERVCVDFGDEQISRSAHAMLTYDPRGNKYYVQQGSGKNLTYLNDAPVLAPTLLEAGNEILIGDTTLRFVPLCDDKFTWIKNDKEKDA